MESIRIIFSGRNLDPQPLSGLDVLRNGYVNLYFVYDHLLDEEILIKSLEKALFLNPYFCGRIMDLDTSVPIITACDSGVLFYVETFSEKIQCFLSIGEKHVKPIKSIIHKHSPLLQIKLSNFINGSILQIAYSHCVCDGQSLFDFLHYWSQLARNKEPGDFHFDRTAYKKLSLGDGVNPDKLFPVFTPDKKIFELPYESINRTFRLTSDFVDGLVNDALMHGIKNDGGLRNSIWTAYVCKLVTSVLKTDQSIVSFISVSSSRFLLGLKKEYFGNATMTSYLKFKKHKIPSTSIEAIAERILSFRNKLITSCDNLRIDIAYWEARVRDKKTDNCIYEVTKHLLNKSGVYFNNLTSYPIYEMDFGSGPPVWFNPRLSGSQSVFATSSPEKNGDIILYVGLPVDEMTELSKHLVCN